jgi:hypothetical protein
MTDLSLIIRLGVSAEAADVWDAVTALCTCPSPSKRLELIAELEDAYRRCEREYRRVEGMVDEYCQPDDAPPGELRHGRGIK